MRDVVIIGGGLSGLAAAHALEARRVAYTLIEVKPRLGGSIHTETRAGFRVDDGPLLTLDAADSPFIEGLGLRDQMYIARTDEDGDWLSFQSGIGAVTEALAAPLLRPDAHGSLMLRMAVSTLGDFDLPRAGRRFMICMENGMVLDARTVIVAAPARYAERIFHTLRPEISYRLLDYRYDDIARVSLGYRRADLPALPAEPPPDYPLTYLHHTDAPGRAPYGHVLIQMGVRYNPARGVSPDVVGEIAALMGWPLNPVMEHVSVWPEADPLMWLRDDFSATLDIIRHLLPEGIALIGSDYLDQRPTLQARIDQGIAAAERVVAWLR